MLTDLNTVKALLGVSLGVTNQDTAITVWLSAADRAIKNYLKRDIEQTTYPGAGVVGDSGYYAGNYSPYLTLRQFPVTSIASLYLDDGGYFGKGQNAFDSTTLLIEGQDFTLQYDGCLPGTTTPCSYSGIVQRIGSLWPALNQRRFGKLFATPIPGNGNIKVAFTAGFPIVPPDLVDACAKFVAVLRRTSKLGVGLQSENLGAYSYTVATAALNGMPELGSMRQLLATYRKVLI